MINTLIFCLLVLKASLFSTWEFSNVPSLRQDLLARGRAHHADVSQSLAIGQISPGPNGQWVISLGYFTYGFLGAFLTLLAVSLPPCLALMIARSYRRIERWLRTQRAMDGVSLGVVGLLITVIWTILHQSGSDWRGPPIALGVLCLASTRKVPPVIILALAGGVGYLVFRSCLPCS
jgi:chromate transporter